MLQVTTISNTMSILSAPAVSYYPPFQAKKPTLF